MNIKYYPTILLLDDGTKYYGWSFSNSIISSGEVVFNTGITGYQEIITDPSYTGQIIIFTYPEIGNTGINNEDNESKGIHVKGIITKNICHEFSNWRSKLSLIEYIKDKKIPHIFGIDTRALTKHIRSNGAMNGCISSKILNENFLKDIVNKIGHMEGANLVNRVTTKQIYKINYEYKSSLPNSYLNYKTNKYHGKKLHIAVIDLGVKKNIILRLLSYGCNITILPADSKYQKVNSIQPDGIVLSNGPGDPSSMTEIIANIAQIINLLPIPIFGICMGHQILSLALGYNTFKLKFGHRGLNHPTGMQHKAEITSQNHGFAIKSNSVLNKKLKITHINLNDSTIAGIIHKSRPIFSVQYHPEASPGPHDSEYLFYHFINLVKLMKLKNNIKK
uniref:Carbamoyl phosphate synthase small chain n=1 Tax=Dicranema revolutum TaxID=239144 RepID=A0A4D6WX47_9FLOR|nr:Carbamoyl phosphate synthase small subunit [Dicranema revolutum]